MARDILAVQSSGMLLERVFSLARDVCHHRRGRLRSKTIRSIMLYMIGKNMKIRKGFEGQDDSNPYLDIDDDDNHSIAPQYISDDDTDTQEPSTIDPPDPLNKSDDEPSATSPGPVHSYISSARRSLVQNRIPKRRRANIIADENPDNMATQDSVRKRRRADTIDEENPDDIATQRPVRKRRTTIYPDYVSH